MRLVGCIGSSALPIAWSALFPTVDVATSWKAPLMQPWDTLRALKKSVAVAWTPGWNPWCAVDLYELQSRRPGGAALRFADLEGLQHRELQQEHADWPGDEEWTEWAPAYGGLGRVFSTQVDLSKGHAMQFRVRACSAVESSGCSQWSQPQSTHTVLAAPVENANFWIRGSGKNAPEYTIIEMDRRTIYRRRDETGLVLAVLSRLDLSLQWLQTYDTHRDRAAAVRLGADIRMFNQSNFVILASTIAWERQATRSLARTLEFCGAFHFGQWSSVFAEQLHYASPESDLQDDSSQHEFGHPFAFIGIPGIGTGMGYEALMYNTGHYVADGVRIPQADIRGILYYDYIARIYRWRDVSAAKADFFLKSSAPAPETLHNPMPAHKQQARLTQLMPAPYTPYVGTLQTQITKLIEANQTVPPYNFAFVLYTHAGIIKVDPRPRQYWLTELERVWSGPSSRYWAHNGSLLLNGTELEDRNCTDFMYFGYQWASPESCGGDNFTDCCLEIDKSDIMAFKCGVGVAPTLCEGYEREKLENVSELLVNRRPFNFNVIDLSSHPFVG